MAVLLRALESVWQLHLGGEDATAGYEQHVRELVQHVGHVVHVCVGDLPLIALVRAAWLLHAYGESYRVVRDQVKHLVRGMTSQEVVAGQQLLQHKDWVDLARFGRIADVAGGEVVPAFWAQPMQEAWDAHVQRLCQPMSGKELLRS